MDCFSRHHRTGAHLWAAVVAGILLTYAPALAAAEKSVTISFYPHCIQADSEDGRNDGDGGGVFGPVPSPGFVAETNISGEQDAEDEIVCPPFEVRDPRTLQTRPLQEGDILDIDIVLANPDEQPIRRVRAWLSYDPNVLEGERIEIDDDAFPVVTPDEQNFNARDGYAMIEASAEEEPPTQDQIRFARVQLRVKKETAAGTPISFYDVQPGGHTTVTTLEGGEEQPLLQKEPGVLHVRFGESTGTGETQNTDDMSDEEETDDGTATGDTLPPLADLPEEQSSPSSVSSSSSASADQGTLFDQQSSPEGGTENGDACTENNECASGLCLGGRCLESGNGDASEGEIPNGGRCSTDRACRSGLCQDGVCTPSSDNQRRVSTSGRQRTAFSLLQIQNLRVTTRDRSVYLAWDPLESSALQGYNVYYGATSGRYIQRRTIPGDDTSITLRNLPQGTTYYFAVRGVSRNGEESAFSHEVSVVVGEPGTSTAPLSTVPFTDGGQNGRQGRNPLQGQVDSGGTTGAVTVPGETGLPAFLILILTFSAVTGTVFAFRRQYSAISHT